MGHETQDTQHSELGIVLSEPFEVIKRLNYI